MAAIYSGYKSIVPSDDVVCDFFGVSAPEFVNALHQGRVSLKDGVFSLNECSVFSSIQADFDSRRPNKTFEGMAMDHCLQLNMYEYDALVLVDIFHRFPFRTDLFVDVDNVLHDSCNNVISKLMFRDSEVKNVTGVGLSGHRSFGHIPFIKNDEILRFFLHPNLFLTPAPKPPLRNIPASLKNEQKSVFRLVRYMDQFHKENLAKIGGKVVDQDPLTQHNGIATKDLYSRGPHPRLKSKLDSHMNSEYGQIQLDKIFKEVIKTHG